ncbi:hypothetical protein BS50DRAFT_587521 [Corynespora cassiicola Philippines]|uniref:Uncharacterized protein n=1 Tax=Corynespora cassiicola Philippines TaxID=1448308 RepID=A0A2T2NSC0_CORCC|nr:hypothetical protein BS50DRAFT_587521 [Corynespora cassiicola Philippines]
MDGWDEWVNGEGPGRPVTQGGRANGSEAGTPMAQKAQRSEALIRPGAAPIRVNMARDGRSSPFFARGSWDSSLGWSMAARRRPFGGQQAQSSTEQHMAARRIAAQAAHHDGEQNSPQKNFSRNCGRVAFGCGESGGRRLANGFDYGRPRYCCSYCTLQAAPRRLPWRLPGGVPGSVAPALAAQAASHSDGSETGGSSRQKGNPADTWSLASPHLRSAAATLALRRMGSMAEERGRRSPGPDRYPCAARVLPVCCPPAACLLPVACPHSLPVPWPPVGPVIKLTPVLAVRLPACPPARLPAWLQPAAHAQLTSLPALHAATLHYAPINPRPLVPPSPRLAYLTGCCSLLLAAGEAHQAPRAVHCVELDAIIRRHDLTHQPVPVDRQHNSTLNRLPRLCPSPGPARPKPAVASGSTRRLPICRLT